MRIFFFLPQSAEKTGGIFQLKKSVVGTKMNTGLCFPGKQTMEISGFESFFRPVKIPNSCRLKSRLFWCFHLFVCLKKIREKEKHPELCLKILHFPGSGF
jgi:hypothetical protein